MILLSVLLTAAAVLLAVPAAALLGQVLVASLPRGRVRADDTPDSARPRAACAVLIPAHNEALGIAGTLASVRAQLAGGDRVLVVADNCTDATAAVARAAGAEVVERHDDRLRGKGYALDHGIRHLAATAAPGIVVIVDADCTLEPSALERLVRACARTGRPAQATYLMHQPPGVDGAGARLAEFAWLLKNLVRPLGLHRLGLPCPLFGTGMAFPRALLETLPLASANIVEDMQLGVDLTVQGVAPLFVPEARVTSQFPASKEGQATQRTRWEHGHLATLLAGVPRLWRRAWAARDPHALGMALDLGIPPLSLLVMLAAALAAVATAAAWLGASALPAWLAGLSLAGIVAAVLLAWHAFGRQLVPAAVLLSAPGLALRKLALYARFFGARQTSWVRSKRDGEQ